MRQNRFQRVFIVAVLAAVFTSLLFPAPASARTAWPCSFQDDSGREIVLENRPERVVSLAPSITDMIFKLGAGDALQGITYHTTLPPETTQKTIVGGYFSPSPKGIRALSPEVVFLSSFHRSIRDALDDSTVVIELEAGSIEDIYRHLDLLGRIFDRSKEAAETISAMKEKFDLTARKTSKIPADKRLRVMRLMGRDQVMTPGDDSFQNDFIRAAGGIPPRLGKKGAVVPVTPVEWLDYNPQVIYGCGGDREVADRFFSLPEWKEVDAVKNHRIYYFPCDLTCRASVHSAYFVAWLASTIYETEFSDPSAIVLEQGPVGEKPVPIDLDYVRSARVLSNVIFDDVHKTLLVDFKQPMKVVNTLEGQRQGITTVGNHYTPPTFWGPAHIIGLADLRNYFYGALDKKEAETSFLFTGADMDNLSVQKVQFKEMVVYALVTAGVKSNAVRVSEDEGLFYEPGTINTIILTNMRLSPRAMTRAVIAATEAKTAAMQDLDIRSSVQPLPFQATGTGTDNVLVVEGTGTPIDNTGGHCKMGELIARAVYQGVTEAVYLQNGLIAKRNIFQRLEERKISLFELADLADCPCRGERPAKTATALQELLLDPQYAAWMASALALSDAWERGLIGDLSIYRKSCLVTAEVIAGHPIEALEDYTLKMEDIPLVLRLAFNALLNGLNFRRP